MLTVTDARKHSLTKLLNVGNSHEYNNNNFN